MKSRTLLMILGIGLLPAAMGQTCLQVAVDGDAGSIDDLTAEEKQAVVSGCHAAGTLAQGGGVAQNATSDLSSDSGKPRASELSFGTCPEVTRTGVVGDATLTIDFGAQPCTVLTTADAETYVCSGTATGTVNLTSRSLELTCNTLSCNDESLDGTVGLTYALLLPGVELEGDWDLTYTYGDNVVNTDGAGKVSYVPVTGCCDVTTIAEFTGTVTEDGYSWTTTMADILVSLEQYGAFMPYSGYVTMDGPDIRAITVTFNENSPQTGEIGISIDGGRSFTVDYEDLEALLE